MPRPTGLLRVDGRAADAADPALIHTDGDNLLHPRHRWNVPVRRTPPPSHVFGCLAGRAGFGPAKPSRATVAGCDVENSPLRTVRGDPPRDGPLSPMVDVTTSLAADGGHL
ncbi:hypothetical protein GCM10025787_14430 [Saccharopolyspora rosea]